MKIVITAFEARPGSGTEAGLAFNWGSAYIQMGHDVAVVTQRTRSSEEDLALWKEKGIDPIFLGPQVRVGAAQTPMDLVRNAFQYAAWSREVRRWFAVGSPPADLVHHVSWGSVRLRPPFKSGGEVRSVWGPLGGGQIADFRGLPKRKKIHEIVRTATFAPAWASQYLAFRFNPGPTLTYVTNRASEKFVRSVGIKAVEPLLADGVAQQDVVESPRGAMKKEPRLLWLGRMVAFKRPDLALLTVSAMCRLGMSPRLTLVGDGPERASLEKLTDRLGIRDCVEFKGRVQWEAIAQVYEVNDILLFTSMRDSSCPTIVEAAGYGVPTVAYRHQGVAYLVPPEVARGPEQYKDDAELVDQFIRHIIGFVEDSNQYEAASRAAISFALNQTWSKKAENVLRQLESSPRQ